MKKILNVPENKNIIFAVEKKSDDVFGYYDRIDVEDVSTLQAIATTYTYNVATQKIGLTKEEAVQEVARITKEALKIASGDRS